MIKVLVLMFIFGVAMTQPDLFAASKVEVSDGYPYITQFYVDNGQVFDVGPLDKQPLDKTPYLAFKYKFLSDDQLHHRVDVDTTFHYNGESNNWGKTSLFYECDNCPSYNNSPPFTWYFKAPDWDIHGQTGRWNVTTSWAVDGVYDPAYRFYNFDVTSPTVTPEPASIVLFGLGAGVLALTGKRKRASHSPNRKR